MTFSRWLRTLRPAIRSHRAGTTRRSLRSTLSLHLDALEDRWVPSFSPPVPYTAGADPAAVLSANLNNDLYPDLVTAIPDSHTVSVLLNDGTGAFGAAINSATGNLPASLAVGDFNEDTVLDLATGNSGNVSILMGNGDGTFDPPVNYTLGQEGHSVAVGDFNNDDNLDLGVVSSVYIPGTWGPYGFYPGWYEGSARVLIGSGTGSFTWGNGVGLGNSSSLYTHSTAVADLNNDGRDDFLVTNPEWYWAYRMLGNPDGSLGAPAFYSLAGYQSDLAAGDVNGDSKADLLSGNYQGVNVRLGDGLGGFGNSALYTTGGQAIAIELGDFNGVGGDGKLDVAVTNYTGNGLSVILGVGDGTFKPPLGTASDSTSSRSLTAGDFDRNGWLDAARINYSSPSVEVFDNDQTWPALNAPALSIADVTVSEGNLDTSLARFTVTLSSASGQTVTAAFRTANLDATAGSDYEALTGTVTFTPGDTSETIEIVVNGDRTPEWTERFYVRLSDSVNAFLGDGTALGAIENDEPTASLTGDVYHPEGHSGISEMTFTVTLSQAYDVPITVTYSTVDFTWEDEYYYGPGARAGEDYIAKSGSITFAANQPSQTVTVQVLGDRVGEWDEMFWFRLNSADYAHLGTSMVLGVIQNDEPFISLESAPSVVEGNDGTRMMRFTARLSTTSEEDVSVDYTTNDGSALAGSDYETTSDTLTIPAGQTTGTIDVPIIGDRIGEWDEYFYVILSNPIGALLGSNYGYGNIQDDEPRISVNNPSPIFEGHSGTKPLVFTVTLSKAYDQQVTVRYDTADGSAIAGQDYIATGGTITFAPGDISETFVVLIKGDKQKESEEWFGVELSANSANSMLWNSYGSGVIKNDDGGKSKH